MADWSDIVGMNLEDARKRADKYGHDVEVMMIEEDGKDLRPGSKDPERTRPAVLVTVDGEGEEAKVLAEHRTVEPPFASKEDVSHEQASEGATHSAEAPESEEEFRPKFGSQFGRDEEELEDEGRPSGFTFNPVEEPSLASKNEHDAAFVGADLKSVLNDPDLPEVFEGKTITVTLGFGERYVFDGDRIHNSLANGEWNVPGGFPENVFVAREGDPMKDPKHAWKCREQQLEYGMRAVAALSAQAKTEIAHREATGGLEPTPACDHIEAFYGESRAAIIAERMDTLSNADLDALSQMNLKKLSQAAIDMLVEGRHTEGPAEEVRKDRESLTPHVSSSERSSSGLGGEASVSAKRAGEDKGEHVIDLAAGLAAVSQPRDVVDFVRSKGLEDMADANLVQAYAATRSGAER